MSDRVVGPLREMRLPLHDGLSALHVAATAATTAELPIAMKALDGALAFLQERILPICRAEEFTLFIAVDGVLGAVDSCQVMKMQHSTMMRMTGDLAQTIEAAKADGDVAAYAKYLHPLLYGLYALIRAHLESEDDAYLPLLDTALSESQVTMIMDNMTRMAAGSAAPE
ncbi:MAG: hemerythrin domain-containing protein [bacterium]